MRGDREMAGTREAGDVALDADERAELVRLRRKVAELMMQRVL